MNQILFIFLTEPSKYGIIYTEFILIYLGPESMVSVELLSTDSTIYLNETEVENFDIVESAFEGMETVVSADNLLQANSISTSNPGIIQLWFYLN